MENPLLVFPEEVWDIILGNLEDSKNVDNALRAFPPLEVVVKKKRHLWYFDQVIPHLFLWLGRKEFLNCRQVCTRWSRGVDKFLENHPSLNVVNPVTDQLWIPEVNPRHYKLFDRFQQVTFRWSGQLNKFLEDMKNHPSSRNPFVGGFLNINPDDQVRDDGERPEGGLDVEDFLADPEKPDRFWNGVQEVLKKYGKHVRFISTSVFLLEPALSICETVMNCLDHLPNLKGIVIQGNKDFMNQESELIQTGEAEAYLDFRLDSIPSLPILETICLYKQPPRSLANVLLTRYSPQLRSLGLDVQLLKHVSSKIFPNLRELNVTEFDFKPDCINQLMSIEAPNLVGLTVDAAVRGGLYAADLMVFSGRDTFIEQDMFPTIKRFPKIQNVKWTRRLLGPTRENGTLTAPNDSIASLKSLLIKDDENLSYYFLTCLPSLEYLTISRWRGEKRSDSDDEDGKDHFQGMAMRRYIHDLIQGPDSDSKIWELLPKLKNVTIVQFDADDEDNEGHINHYRREDCEYGRRMLSLQAGP